MGLFRNVFKVFSANLVTLATSLVVGFLVPVVLPIGDYANLKEYTFYISYIGLLHFGFIDGMYIKYGGKTKEEIDRIELKCEHNIFIFIQLIVTIFFIILAFLQKNIIIFLMATSIIPINFSSFYKFIYQATGEFQRYSRITYIYSILYLVINIVLVTIKSENYIFYCLANVISNLIVFIFLEYRFYKEYFNIEFKYDSKVWDNIKVGFFVLLGNLAVLLFYGLDRWFIKWFYSVDDFAFYSFAVSMLNIINVLVGAISITFYNYIAKNEKKEELKKIKRILISIGVLASGSYFVLAGIVNVFLKKYIPALDIIAISFAAYPYIIVINSIFVNLYKARKDERKYLKVVLFMLAIAFILNIIVVIRFNNPINIAFSTTISFIIWFLYSGNDFKYLKSDWKEKLFLCTSLILFLICSHYFNWIYGGIIYFIVIIIIIIIYLNKEIISALNIIKQKFNI